MDENYSVRIGKIFTVSPRCEAGSDEELRKPCARSGHAAVADDKYLYVYGGYNPDISVDDEEMEMEDYNPLFKEMWRFDFDRQSWELLKNRGTVPMQLASMSMTRCGHIIILYGGTGFPFGYQKSSALFCFSTRDNRWRAISGSKETPDSTYGQSVSVCGTSLYVFGGTSGWDYSANVYKSDLRTGIWEKCFDFEKHYSMLIDRQIDEKDIPLPRYRHEMLSDEENLYIIGGGTSHHAFPLERIHVFNTKLKKWTRRDSIPDPVHGFPRRRRCHGCCQLRNVGYITGGYDGRHIYNDVWSLAIDSLQWTKLEAKLPEPVYFHSSAITPEGCLYYHGGVLTSDGKTRTDKLNFLWVTVPSLMTMSWKCILKANPKLRDKSADVLRELGIPEHIIKR